MIIFVFYYANLQILKHILLLSDNHSYLDDRILHYAANADEIWHAGDIGDISVLLALENTKPTKAVYGNIDSSDIRLITKEYQIFECEGKKILMIHIGGYPGKYTPQAKLLIDQLQPDIMISGHSHILKVMQDKTYNLLHLNPGACGKIGWHQTRTMLRFVIDKGNLSNLEVIELGPK